MIRYWGILGGLSLLIAACGGWSDPTVGTISGKVISTTGQPVGFISINPKPVQVSGVASLTEKGIVTRASGEFAVVLPAGTYDLQVPAPSGLQSQRVVVRPGQVTSVDLIVEMGLDIPHLGMVHPCSEGVPPPTQALGNSLGSLWLGMAGTELPALLGNPVNDFPLPDGRFRWFFADRTMVTFASTQRDRVVEVYTGSPVVGVTAEGLSIGDSIEDFGGIYQGFSVCISSSSSTLYVTGSNGHRLEVMFSEARQVITLTLSVGQEDTSEPFNIESLIPNAP